MERRTPAIKSEPEPGSCLLTDIVVGDGGVVVGDDRGW
jgi:hypothetical protein